MMQDHSTEMVHRRERQQQRLPPTLQDQVELYKLVASRRVLLGMGPLKFRPFGRSRYTGEMLPRFVSAQSIS